MVVHLNKMQKLEKSQAPNKSLKLKKRKWENMVLKMFKIILKSIKVAKQLKMRQLWPYRKT